MPELHAAAFLDIFKNIYFYLQEVSVRRTVFLYFTKLRKRFCISRLKRKIVIYAPWNNIRKNRSRIDFFLVSKECIDKVNNCYIKPSVQSKLFDHKAIIVDFIAKPDVSSRPNISSRILRDPDIEIIVKLAAYECYTQNIEDGNIKHRALRLIGRRFKLIRQAGPDPKFTDYSYANLLDIDARDRIMFDIRNVMEDLERMNITGLAQNIEADTFLEYLMNNIRNEVISYHSFISKTVNQSLNNLIERLTVLKENFEANFDEISDLELKLREINENKVNAILEKNKNFENLNGERITPFFLKMVKGSTQEASLTAVRDYEGRPFPTQEAQKDFIRNHFANSFKKPENEPENLEGCIERFLGDGILVHPLVQNMKLSEAERNTLKNDLSLEELDNALDGANSNSAAGIDGINTRFIKQFWFIFREPLQRYATTCFQNGAQFHC